ncbi:MAG: alpha/beta hydrolase fold protein [Actinomycetia bacterium]|nr:alpha/beta hydrolase fold protein [Actinomycetes bacterium]
MSIGHGPALKRLTRVGPAEVAAIVAGDPAAPPVLFLHGFPTHGWLWRKVLVVLGDDIRALVPDLLGLGDTVVSPYADFSMPAQAELLLDWLDRLGVDRVAVVAHDQGGAVAHQLVANHPERVSHLGLVDVVAYDNWPVRLVAALTRLARTPGIDTAAYALGLPRPVGRLVFRRAVQDSANMPDDVIDEYLRPLLTPDGRERARRFVLAGDARHTLECLPGLRAWDGPAFVAWGADDAFLSPSWGLRLVDDLRGAERLELLPFCGHLAPEERPDELAGLIRDLLAR